MPTRQAPHHQTNRLSDRQIKAGIRKAPEIGKLMLPDGKGLYLQIHNKVPSWLHRYQLDNKTRAMGLGRFPAVSLEQAREKHEDNQRLLHRGIDPMVHRAEEAEAEQIAAAAAAAVPTVKQCGEIVIQREARTWKNPRSEQQWRNSLAQHVWAKIGDKPVNEPDLDMVVEALRPVWTTNIVTGERIRARLQKIFAYAKGRKYRSDNPAEWEGGVGLELPKLKEVHEVTHFADLPYERIAKFMTELRACDDLGARALELLILTNSRTNEVLGARKDEVDLAKRTWTRPASRMKSYKKPHTVTLSESAMTIVRKALDDPQAMESPFLFPGENPDRPLVHSTLRRLMAGMGYAEFDVHGFRACFRTWVQDCTNLDRIAAEIALAHRVGSVVEETYARGEMFAKRRVLADAWNAYCNGEATGWWSAVVELPAGCPAIATGGAAAAC